LFVCVSVLCHMNEVAEHRWVNFLVFATYEKS